MMSNLLKSKTELLPALLVVILMTATFITRAINLNYNSAFNDEAIYIIVGLMGFFERDWWTYNASSWIPGLQYLYPSFTAIAYNLGGLAASRLANVLLSVLLVELILIITGVIYDFIESKKTNLVPTIISPYSLLAGFVAGIFIAGSDISNYVSRLATYDMPSFTFLFLSLLLLIHTRPVSSGKRYFFASLFLSLSYLTKIISGIYLPLILIYFAFFTKKTSQRNYTYFKHYFVIPTLIILAIFGVFSFSSLLTYFSSQTELAKSSYQTIAETALTNTKYLWAFWIPASLGLFLKKQFHLWAVLTFSALWIIVFHLFNLRVLSLDKHLLIMISFLSIINGLGLASLISLIRPKFVKLFAAYLLIFLLSYYWLTNFQNLKRFENLWKNTGAVEKALAENVRSGDKVLVESGSTMILATYYKNYPTNTSTFDWLRYRNDTGETAFKKAVRDGYFDLIELESDLNSKSQTNDHLSKLVKQNLQTNYNLIFDADGFLVYKRAY